jgi:hypothetical protein
MAATSSIPRRTGSVSSFENVRCSDACRGVPGLPHSPTVGEFRVTFTAGVAAAELWAFGEDDLAEAVLGFSEEDLAEVWRLGAIYNDDSFPLPVVGRTVSLGHVMCFACMMRLEHGLRPLARQRRRPAKTMPEHLRVAATTGSGPRPT